MASHAPTISSNQNKQQEEQSSFLLPLLAVPQLSPPVAPPPMVPVINGEPCPVQNHPLPQHTVAAPVLRVPMHAVTPPPADERLRPMPLPRVNVDLPQPQGTTPNNSSLQFPKSRDPVAYPNNARLTNPPFLPPQNVTPWLFARGPLPKIYAPAPDGFMQHPSLVAFHVFDKNGKKQSIDDLLKGPMKEMCIRSTGNEMRHLSDGIEGRVKGSGTIAFIIKEQVQIGKKVTYANMVCDHRPLKVEQFHVRLTIGGDKLIYADETASPAADLLKTKLLINSTISNARKGAHYMVIDIKDFFLQTPLPKQMCIHVKYFDNELKKLYSIDSIINKGRYVYCEIKKG
eukprot:15366086-Ditylum_brightwellii.AAC.2